MSYNHRVTDFFTLHKLYDPELFKYFKANSTMIDYDIEEYQEFVGCWPNTDKHNIITGLHVNTPYVKDDKTALITIHELVHAIDLYTKLGEPYQRDITVEALPLLYEKLYILSKNSEELTAYGKYLDSKIYENPEQEYLFGLSIREELIKNYDYDFGNMQKLVKKLARKK